ncbi:MAG: N-methyl-L-tryptophan oxidase [Caldimonas sp.]
MRPGGRDGAAPGHSTVTANVIVVGLGAFGSAITHHLARRGARVIGIDRFHPPHDQGSSHGESRITRLAVGEGADYVPFVTRSHALWRELEAETGAALYRRTGGVVIASADADRKAYHGQSAFFRCTVDLAARFGIAHELLDAAEIRHRYPQFEARDDEHGYLERDAGVLAPERCVRAQLQAAASCGAVLRLGERVVVLEEDGDGMAVVTDRARLHADHVVIATGAWLPALVGGAFSERLKVRRQVLQWFRATAPQRWAPEVCPVFIWLHGGSADDEMYGFPMGDGLDGVKVATEQTTDTTDPDAVDRVVGDGYARAVFEHHVRGRLRDLVPEVVHSATCLYTVAPGSRFVVDRHPRFERVTVVSACSGHGFKHSAGLGEAVAQRVLGEVTGLDLSMFAMPA